MARKSRKQRDAAPDCVSQEFAQTIYNTAFYLRLSILDGGKKDGETIINQQELLNQFITEHPELLLKRVFVDNGESGVDFIRPAWNDLMAECRAGNINCICVKDLSRVGRNYIETGDLLENIFPLLGVRVIAVNDSYDSLTVTTGGKLVANLKNLVNDIYAKDISRKVSSALRTKQKQGAFIGSYAAYGYLKDPNDKNKIIIDPETAPILRQIFEWKADGMGSNQICRKLAEMNVPAPNAYRFQRGIVKCERFAASVWTSQALKAMLTNEVYIGNLVQGRRHGALYEDGGTHKTISKSDWTVVEGTNEPLVSRELFDRANAVIRERADEIKAKQGRYDHFEKPELILKGLVFCADCGKPLGRTKNVTGKQKQFVHWIYQCRTDDMLRTCPHKYIEECDLYGAVYDAIRLEILKAVDISGIISKLNGESGHKSRLARFDMDIEESVREIKRLFSLRQAVYEDYAAKILTTSEYKFATEKYAAETEKQQNRLEAAKREKAEYSENSTPVNKWLAAFLRFMDTRELNYDMAHALIERIEVSDRNRVKVMFKFRDEFAAISDYSEVSL